MLSEQDKLPRLPINSLEDAIQDFLRASEPLLSPVEYARTKQQADEFLQKEGPAFHRMLTEYDEEEECEKKIEDIITLPAITVERRMETFIILIPNFQNIGKYTIETILVRNGMILD